MADATVRTEILCPVCGDYLQFTKSLFRDGAKIEVWITAWECPGCGLFAPMQPAGYVDRNSTTLIDSPEREE